MKITENVYFDGDEVTINEPVRVIYSGFLTKNSPKEIYMHYGYGLGWDNLQEIKLIKGINGYESDIVFYEFGNVNFCFRSFDGSWDNNNGANYSAEIKNKEYDFPTSDSLALVEIPKLKSGYLVRKKIRITFFKIIAFIGKIFSGKIIKRKKI